VLIGPVLIVFAAAAIDYAALRTVDRQLATIAHRLVTANAPICAERAPAPGFVLHARDQYAPEERARVTAALGFPAPVAVEAVVAGSAAARAGMGEGDGLVAVNGRPLPANEGATASSVHRDAARASIESAPADAPLRLTLRRDGQDREVAVPASPGCRSSFELVLGPDLIAHADGATVQIGSAWFARVSDDEVAVLVAHELAHNILGHRARLDAAGVSRGMLAEVGRNGRLIRRTEEEADRLSVHLLRNAGYDPRIAIRFWQGPGDKADGGLFRSRTHAGAKSRAKLIEAEIATIPVDAGLPYAPPVLRTRDEVLE
jgi:hypothetical protein